MELGGFGVNRDEKGAMWREATEQAINMTVMSPYPGFAGKYFQMPCRNVVPKPVQKPHPPIWMACSRRESIHKAARNGVGALAFAFVEPEQAAKWVAEYYDIIRSEECVPIGWSVNANVALVSGMSCHADEDEAIRRGLDGFRFFGYSLGHYASFGAHRPTLTDLWARFLEVKDEMPRDAGSRRDRHAGSGARASAALRAGRRRSDHLRAAERQQPARTYLRVAGAVRRQPCMPEFKAREAERAAEKERELAPYHRCGAGAQAEDGADRREGHSAGRRVRTQRAARHRYFRIAKAPLPHPPSIRMRRPQKQAEQNEPQSTYAMRGEGSDADVE